MGSIGLFSRRLIVVAVFFHVFAVSLYVLPNAWIPEGLRVLAVAYVRPLFHQQWQLFAPDPPLCHGELQVSFVPGNWRSLHMERDHYLEQRMKQNIVRHFQTAVHSDPAAIHPILEQLLIEACSPHGDPSQAQFRLMEWCVTDPQAPMDREIRITPIAR